MILEMSSYSFSISPFLETSHAGIYRHFYNTQHTHIHISNLFLNTSLIIEYLSLSTTRSHSGPLPIPKQEILCAQNNLRLDLELFLHKYIPTCLLSPNSSLPLLYTNNLSPQQEKLSSGTGIIS